jgi:hypothetical protein
MLSRLLLGWFLLAGSVREGVVDIAAEFIETAFQEFMRDQGRVFSVGGVVVPELFDDLLTLGEVGSIIANPFTR